MQVVKIGSDILDAVTRLNFAFEQGSCVSKLPIELHTLFDSSGKRFRPALVFLFGRVYGLTAERLTPFARAVEMTHTASLVHDDVIDMAPERRKVPTLNHRFSNTQAILAGDYLLASVIHELAHTGELELIKDLTHSIKELADGEWLQAKLKSDGKATWAELETVARKKTGSLMLWSTVTAAKLAKASAAEIEAARTIGDDIGVFFQMLDDVNDFNSQSGKPFAADLRNGQLNFVTAYMLEQKPELQVAFKQFKESGELTCRAELEQAKKFVIEASQKLEADLNRRFSALAHARSPECVEIFAKMLSKVRETFSKA